jgi:hypothetical protein
MSLFVTLAADILVAVLLAATIVTSLRLSRRIGQMKGDEAALRQTIGDLMVATGTAERAIAGLRAAIDDADRTLNASLDAATARSAELKLQVEAGETVVTASAPSSRRCARCRPGRSRRLVRRAWPSPSFSPCADRSRRARTGSASGPPPRRRSP